MASFTCITCRVAFADAENQRAHYKGDWHRYNLKRKVAELQPISAESYIKKAESQLSKQVSEGAASSHCEMCNKHFTSVSTFNNHLKSKKHREAGLRQTSETHELVSEKTEKKKTSVSETVEEATDKDAASDAGSSESWEGEPLSVEECLFCPIVSEGLETNVKHMLSAHSFFIPDTEYLADLEGLITYLGEKVGAMNMCLWCCDSGRAFYTTDSVKRHMIDKGHCKMRHEGDTVLEYADFYDYRSSYPDYVPGEEKEDDEVTADDIDGDDYALVLPSGSTIGHRSLARYYRQNLKPSVVSAQRQGAISNVVAHYRSFGWNGTTAVAAQKKAKDIAFAQRLRSRHYTKLGMRANKLHMKYFRSQIFAYGTG